MTMLNMLTDILPSWLPKLGMPWWVEITTTTPACIYYFGPFESFVEAQAFCPGYVEDLEGEGARGLKTSIKRCQPEVLTIAEDLSEPVTEWLNGTARHDLSRW